MKRFNVNKFLNDINIENTVSTSSEYNSVNILDFSNHKSNIIYLFIMLAANPAPKPLSIFTTVTPEAHVLSIPSNAAAPPKLAP